MSSHVHIDPPIAIGNDHFVHGYMQLDHEICKYMAQKRECNLEKSTFGCLGKGILGGVVLEKTNPNMPNKGGPRHIQKPYVDAKMLHTCFEKHKDLLKDMHAYDHISSACAPDPKALLSLQPLWSGLVGLEASGSTHPQPMRQALLSLLGEFPELNTSKSSGSVWCNLKVERLNCMLAHVRKLARPNTDNGPVVAKLTASEYAKLKAGLEQLELDGLEKPIKLPVEEAPTEALEKASSSKAPAEALEKADAPRSGKGKENTDQNHQ